MFDAADWEMERETVAALRQRILLAMVRSRGNKVIASELAFPDSGHEPRQSRSEVAVVGTSPARSTASLNWKMVG